MPKVRVFPAKPATAYDLTKSFVAKGETKKWYKSQDDLVLWLDLRASPRDRSGKNHSVTYTGSPSVGATSANDFDYNYVTLNGDQHAIVPDSDDFSHAVGTDFFATRNNLSFTVSAWIYVTSLSTSRTIFCKGFSGDNSITSKLEYYAHITTAGKLFFNFTDGKTGKTVTVTTLGSVSVDTWYHVAFTSDGLDPNLSESETDKGMHVYINGKETKVELYSGAKGFIATENLDGSLAIGTAWNTSVKSFVGNIAEFAMWRRALNENEIYSIYKATTDGVITKYKSGIVSNPPRVRIRQKDSMTGSYPTISRMGDKDRRGTHKTSFNDSYAITYGKMIKDNFIIKPKDRKSGKFEISTRIDKGKWKYSTGMEIRQEIFATDSFTYKDTALVFAGPAGSSRYLQTKDKLRNPEVEFFLIQGPHNQNAGKLDGLRLHQGLKSDLLTVQISTDETNWTTIKTFNITNPNVTAGATATTAGGNTDNDITIAGSQEGSESLPAWKQNVIRVQLDNKNFVSAGGLPFYIRLNQSTPTQRSANWAIKAITIRSNNQNVTYPLLLNTASLSGRLAKKDIVATPNMLGGINETAKSVSGISDVNFSFTSGENISPFDDSLVFGDTSDEFYNIGTHNDIYPGLSSKLGSKTRIIVNLSPSNEDTFGMNNRSTDHDSGDAATHFNSLTQSLMVYWNPGIRRWENVVGGYGSNNSRTAAGGVADLNNTASLVASASRGILGFAPINVRLVSGGAAPGSSVALHRDAATIMSPSFLKATGRPTDVYGFPFAGQYYATASQYVIAKDIGITKPFVFEKASLKFQSKFEIPSNQATATQNDPYSVIMSYYSSNPSQTTLNGSLMRVMNPSFFILRQFNKEFYKTISTDFERASTSGIPRIILSQSINTPFSGAWGPTTDKNTITGVKSRMYREQREEMTPTTAREMITYGQMTLITSTSNSQVSNYALGENPNLKPSNFLENGLSRDLDVVVEHARLDHVSLTGSYEMNFPCRSTPQIPKGVSFLNICLSMTGSNGDVFAGSNQGAFMLTNEGGRGLGGLDEGARAIANPFSAYNPSEVVLTPHRYAPSTPTPVTLPKFDDIDIESPYIIFPEDKLIFGWQFPACDNPLSDFPGANHDGLYTMTLFGNSKLVMYGSMLKEGKEIHDPLNQNLASDAIHEIIGAESITDQFVINDRSEYAQTHNDRQPVKIPAYENLPPSVRIGVRNVSMISGSIMSSSFHGDDTADAAVGFAPITNIIAGLREDAKLGQFHRHTSLFDTNRKYYDSQFGDGYFYYAGHAAGRDGFTQGDGNISDGHNLYLKHEGIRWRTSNYGTFQTNGKTIGPKYAFSLNKFGQYADMIDFGKDSRFIKRDDQSSVLPMIGILDGYIESPVKTVFVTSSLDLTNFTKNFFGPIKPKLSANKSLFSTSSFGFCEIGLSRTVIGLNEFFSIEPNIVVPVPSLLSIIIPDF